ncbi:MAG: hypothetical protein IKV97_03020 [Clostridia bacterium]|nr:hypothetical protein [Clostridia bacterium]
MIKNTFKGVKTREISFPLGGIGTGCIGLLGNGRLADFEMFGCPNKKRLGGLSFFAVKAEKDGKLIDARVLNTDSFETRTGFEQYRDIDKVMFHGYGFGPSSSTLAGVPHFPASEFSARFPFAEIDFSYEKFPGNVKMTAFNPFIPLNDEDSSIPAALFEFEIENTTDSAIDYTICGSLDNPLEKGKNSFDGDMNCDMKCIRLYCSDDIQDDGALDSKYNAKNLCIATDCEDVSYQEYLFRGMWFDTLQIFWDDFTSRPNFKNRYYETSDTTNNPALAKQGPGVIAAHITVAPGEKKTVRFVISWYMRFMTNYWSPLPRKEGESEQSHTHRNRWKNYYCRFFSSSVECASYCFSQWQRLKNETNAFTEALFSSTLPDEVIDAVSSNLCILKSSTIMRHSDGSILGFEGAHANAGSCEGNCTHVYSYAYALAHLFPKLERSIRENEYRYNMDENGSVAFRVNGIIGTEPDSYFPCADGQMMGIVKTYREFKLCGDIDWLRAMWPQARASLNFAFDPANDFKWDPNKTGILSGRQHNTLDTELYSPNSWMQGLYCAALLCAAEMSEILGYKEDALQYRQMFENGKKYLNEELFNGKYYCQKIDLTDKSLLSGFETLALLYNIPVEDYYWSEELGEIKYQIGEGSAIDQTLAQWHANNIGLGEIFEKEKLLSALDTIYNVNFKKTMRDFFNPCRNFCINDEGGVVICAYPEGAKKPKIPAPYGQECMNGFEYQAAVLMIQSGMVDQGLEIVRAIRQRYDGEYRNPFAEMECGSSYIRSLASYTLLGAISGFGYNLYKEEISFKPLMRFAQNGYFRCFFSAGKAYGTLEVGPKYVEMDILSGEFMLRRFEIFAEPKIVYYGGRKLEFKAHGNTAEFCTNVKCNKEKRITIIFD